MALAIRPSSPASSDPTAILQQALSDFERALTVEQRGAYTRHTQNARRQKPDSVTVIQFIAELDAVGHGRLRKSVAPRLQTVLDAVQQFTSIVDTFVSSNPAVGALVWGGVKTAILTASNVANYFDKITTLVMTLGKTCPIYREFALLYSDSIPLQYALSEYYAIIVRLATKIIEVSQRTGFAQILSSIVSPFESDFQPFRDQLHESGKTIKLQVSLAAARAVQETLRLAKEESRKNKQQHELIRRFRSEFRAERDDLRLRQRAQQSERAKDFIRDQLSTVDHIKPWKQIRKRRLQQTAEWFSTEQTFVSWRADCDTSLLWCPGRMGVGKSVLIANIITFLFRRLESNQVISHHFCCAEDVDSTSARGILGTIARQLLSQHIESAQHDEVERLRTSCQGLDELEVVQLLLARLRTDQDHYIVIDGLDECARDEIITLTTCVVELLRQRSIKFHILISGRRELESILFKSVSAKYQMPVSPIITSADVGRYIDSTLDQCLEDGRIQLSNPETIVTIAKLLHEQYSDSFLFVTLFIEDLCNLMYEQDILAALQNPPKRISDLLQRRIDRIQQQGHATAAVQILQYCGVTKRPLTVDEYSELLSISPFQPSLGSANAIRSPGQAIVACCGLVYIDEEYDTVHYIHSSVRWHLFHDQGLVDMFDRDKLDLHLGILCLTYLNFNDFERQLVRTSKTTIAPANIGLTAVQDSSSLTNKAARVLLRSRKKLQSLNALEFSRAARDILGEQESQDDPSFYLLSYVRHHWLQHTTKLTPEASEENSMAWRLFQAFVRGSNDYAERPWALKNSFDEDLGQFEFESSLYWGVRHTHTALLIHLVTCYLERFTNAKVRDTLRVAAVTSHRRLGRAFVDHAECLPPMMDDGLVLAVIHGSTTLVEVFTEARSAVNLTSAKILQVALKLAVAGGYSEVVARLLTAKPDVNAVIGDVRSKLAKYSLAMEADLKFSLVDYGKTALQTAVRCGHLEIVEQLLEAGADVNKAPAEGDRTALSIAATYGHLEVVKRLVAVGAHVDAPVSRVGGTALQDAAQNGRPEVVKCLLAAKANVNARPATFSGTALQLAARPGHLKVVELLLAAGADVNAPAGVLAMTALQLAAEKGHLEVVEQLLAAGADTNAPAGAYIGKTLQIAAQQGHVKIVEQLLAAGADVDVRSGFGDRTALSAAAEFGHLEVVERLMEAGADVNKALGERSQTALLAATCNGHLEVVERLLAAGADVDVASDVGGKTALFAAAKGGHSRIVERLLAAGADVNLPSDVGERTALSVAAEYGRLEVVERLLAAGAHVDATDSMFERTTLSLAVRGNHHEVADLLRRAGAK